MFSSPLPASVAAPSRHRGCLRSAAHGHGSVVLGLRVCLVLLLCALGVAPRAATLEQLAERLTQSNLREREAAILAIGELDDARRVAVLQGLLAGTVYHRRSDGALVYAEERSPEYLLTGLLDGADLGTASSRDLRKVSINNRLRTYIRATVARARLASDDPRERIDAVQRVSRDLDADVVAVLRELQSTEHNAEVRAAVDVALAMVDVGAEDAEVRLAAVRTLGDSFRLDARNRLQELVNSARSDPRTDGETVAAARAALVVFEKRVQMSQWIETLVFGLSLGSVLALAAIGLAITFGVMGVINMAHGELIMLGAYTTYVVQLLMPNAIDWSLLVAIPAAFLVAALFGVLIERGVIRFLYGRPLETLLATFGVSLLLQQLVRSVFSPLNRAVQSPSWLSGSYEVNALLSFTYNRMAIIVFTLLVFVALMVFMKRTGLGLQVRAVAQNRDMARALGVRSARVDMLTFALGSGIAGVAGVALSQLTNVGPNLGQAYIVDSFLVVVFGGVGSLWGTLVSAMTLGVANKIMEPWAGAVLAKVLVLVFIIIFIQRRPRGLFPHKGRAAEG